MKSFLDFLLMFVIVAVALYVTLGAILTIHSVNVGDCTPNENGTLSNCSLSNADYAQLNKTETAISFIYPIQTNFLWLLVLGSFITLLLAFRRGK